MVGPAVEVMVGNAPRFHRPPGASGSSAPTATTRRTPPPSPTAVSAAATVTASVTADDGSPVRTLEPAEVTGGLACNSWNNQVAWDGKDDAGKVVAAGVYTLRLHAVDAGGRTGDASVRLGVDPRIPGALTSPAAGETLAGLARFVFQPTSGFGLDEVQLSFDTGGSARIFNASPDGTWRTSMYTGGLEDGPDHPPHGRALHRRRSAPATGGPGPTVPVVIDATGLPLTAVADPPAGPAPLATTFHLTTSDPAGSRRPLQRGLRRRHAPGRRGGRRALPGPRSPTPTPAPAPTGPWSPRPTPPVPPRPSWWRSASPAPATPPRTPA